MSIRRVLLVCAAALVGHADGQAITVVSPRFYADREAPGRSGNWPAASRVQGIHNQTAFASLPTGGATLTEWSLRPDGSVQVGEQAGFGRLQISVSVTQVDPADMSRTFASNITGTPTVVYDGPWSATTVSEDPPGPATRPFDWRVPFQTPFFYDPAEGNLLIDWIFEMPSVTMNNRARFDNADAVIPEQRLRWSGWLGVDSPVAINHVGFSVVQEFTFISDPLLGDLNLDGDVNGLDVDPFVDVLLSGPYQVEADMNGDQVVSGLDVAPFVTSVVDGGTRPVPEPATLLLACVALGLVAGWRRSCSL
jgi:hypothetical protein